MKRFVLAAIVLVCALPLRAQQQNFPGPTSGTGAPTGSCQGNALYTDTTTGNLYSCKNGAWILAGNGGYPGVTSPGSGSLTGSGTATFNIGSFNSSGMNFADIACGAQAVGNASQVRSSCSGTNEPNFSPNAGAYVTYRIDPRDAKADDTGSLLTIRSILDCQNGVKCADDSANTRTDLRSYMLGDGNFIHETMLTDLPFQANTSDFVGTAATYQAVNATGVGTIQSLAVSGNTMGIWQMQTAAANPSEELFVQSCSRTGATPNASACMPGASSTPFIIEWRVGIQQTVTSYFAVGLNGVGGGSTFTGPPFNGIWCEVTNGGGAGNWQCITRAAGTSTTVTLSPIQTANTSYHVIRFLVSSSSVTFYFDGVNVGSSTTNIPTVGTDIEWDAKTTTASVAQINMNGWIWDQKL